VHVMHVVMHVMLVKASFTANKQAVCRLERL
jgi:hypothetical protein